MYKISLNSRITKQGLSKASYSTSIPPRQGGMSKYVVGGLAVSAASVAYYQRHQKDNDFYHGDSDHYAKLKQDSKDFTKELNYAGDHIKNSAEQAAKAARDTFSTISKDSQQEIHKLKDESKRFVEGDSIEEIYGRKPTYIEHNPMVDEKLNTNKTKSTKENMLENYAEYRVHDTTPLVSKDTIKVKPVWDDNSKESYVEKEIKTTLEDTKHNVLDTTSALGHGMKSTLFGLFGSSDSTHSSTGRETWESRLGAENVISSRTDQDIIDANKPVTPEKKGTSYDFYGIVETEGNPMVSEKLNTKKTKPLWETSLEEHAQEVVHDTSTLVDKDTQKVRQGVWDAKDLANEKTNGALTYKKRPGFWATLFGKADETKSNVEHDMNDKWLDLKEKAEETKDDVKRTASRSWEDAKERAQSEAERVKNDVSFTIDDLSNKSKQEKSRLESGWNNLKEDAIYDAEYARQKVDDTASTISGKFRNESDKLASEVKKTAEDVKNEGSRLARRASEDISSKAKEVKDEGVNLTRRASDHIYSKAEEVKDKAEEVKDNAENLYEEGTEQVKSGINSVKNTADQDIYWIGDTLHDGVEGIKETFTEAKQEISHLFGKRRDSGYNGHVIRGEKIAEDEVGQLRPTRDNVELKPAEVVVEEAHSKGM